MSEAPGGQQHRFLFFRHFAQHFRPGDVTGSDLEKRDVGIQHVHRFQIVGRRKIFDPAGFTLLLERRRPLPGKTGLLINLEDAFLPLGLMGQLLGQTLKASLADDPGGPKILEFGGVGSRLAAQADQQLGSFQVSIVIGRNIGDKVGGVLQANRFLSQFQGRHAAAPVT